MGWEKYADIINLPRPVSGRHPPVSNHDRAAQFAPFAALTGYDDRVKEEDTYAALIEGDRLVARVTAADYTDEEEPYDSFQDECD